MDNENLKDIENKLILLNQHMFKLVEHQKVNDERVQLSMQRQQDIDEKIDFVIKSYQTETSDIKKILEHHEHIITGNGSIGLDEQVRNLTTWKTKSEKEQTRYTKTLIILGAVLVILLSVIGQQFPAIGIVDIIKTFFF